MAVDVFMFSLMGLAVAYLVRRLGDGAPLTLVACAAALLTVVSLSIVLAAIGGRPLEGSYETAVMRFAGSLAGAIAGVLLASRQRTLLASGGDLPIWVSDKSVGWVLAGVFVVGIAILELHRAGLWVEGVGGGNDAVPRSYEPPRTTQSVSVALPAHQASAKEGLPAANTLVEPKSGASGQTPASSEKSAATARATPPRQASHAESGSHETPDPAQKSSSAVQTSGQKRALGTASAPIASSNSASTSAESTVDSQLKQTNAAASPPTQVAASSASPESKQINGGPSGQATESPQRVQVSEEDSKNEVPRRAVLAGQSVRATAPTCNNWYGVASLIRACVALPCENCRARQEVRHAVMGHDIAEFSRGLHDCYSPKRAADGELADRCTRADVGRAMGYAKFFLAHPQAAVPDRP